MTTEFNFKDLDKIDGVLAEANMNTALDKAVDDLYSDYWIKAANEAGMSLAELDALIERVAIELGWSAANYMMGFRPDNRFEDGGGI